MPSWCDATAIRTRRFASGISALGRRRGCSADRWCGRSSSLADCREPDKSWGYCSCLAKPLLREKRRRKTTKTRLDSADEMYAAPTGRDGDYEQVERAARTGAGAPTPDPETREVFVLKHTEGLAYEELEGVTGATVASLKNADASRV